MPPRLKKLLAIDPGKKAGLAVFRGQQLVWCALARMEKPLPPLPTRSIEQCVIEFPVYDKSRNIKPSSIIDLAYTAGRLVEHYYPGRDPKRVKPSDWKGQRPKDVDMPYTLRLLTPPETEVVNESGCPPSLLHNVVDAIGLGLWYVGRR